MILIYETHSTTTDNERGIASGWNGGELSELGRRQALDLGARHRDPAPDLVVSSDLARALQTVEIAFGDTTIATATDARLRECNYGDMNGAPTADVEAERPGRIDVPFPNGESYRDVVLRTKELIDALIDVERVVLVAHRAQLYALEHLIDGVPLTKIVTAPYTWRPGWSYELTR